MAAQIVGSIELGFHSLLGIFLFSIFDLSEFDILLNYMCKRNYICLSYMYHFKLSLLCLLRTCFAHLHRTARHSHSHVTLHFVFVNINIYFLSFSLSILITSPFMGFTYHNLIHVSFCSPHISSLSLGSFIV